VTKPSDKRLASPARRPPKRSRDPQASRRALVEAAAQLFNSVGYHGTDTNRIAIAAGYTPGTFYTHFEDKRAIFLEVYRRWLDDEIAAVAVVLDSEEPSRRVRLARVVLEHHRKWRIFRASLRALYATDPAVREARLAERSRQLDLTLARRGRKGKQARAEILAAMLIAEALADSIADGDVAALGVREADLFRILTENI
jgi:AcrR family transcriptional regulator